MRSSNPWLFSRFTMCAITGRSRTGTIGLGISNVIGFSRVPRPAASTIAFMRRCKLAQPAREIGPLLSRERVDRHSERRELQSRDLAIDLVGHRHDGRLDGIVARGQPLD